MPLSSSLDRLLLNFYAYHGSNVQYCSTGANQDDIRLIIRWSERQGRNVKWKWLEMSRIVGGGIKADLKHPDVSIARGGIEGTTSRCLYFSAMSVHRVRSMRHFGGR
jgi:hypothetical protein